MSDSGKDTFPCRLRRGTNALRLSTVLPYMVIQGGGEGSTPKSALGRGAEHRARVSRVFVSSARVIPVFSPHGVDRFLPPFRPFVLEPA